MTCLLVGLFAPPNIASGSACPVARRFVSCICLDMCTGWCAHLPSHIARWTSLGGDERKWRVLTPHSSCQVLLQLLSSLPSLSFFMSQIFGNLSWKRSNHRYLHCILWRSQHLPMQIVCIIAHLTFHLRQFATAAVKAHCGWAPVNCTRSLRTHACSLRSIRARIGN